VLVGLIIASALTSNQQRVASVPPNIKSSTVPVGQPAPNFSLPDTDNKSHSLSDYKGKVVMLEMMAPWCPHCQEDAAMLNQLAEKYKDNPNVQFLAINASFDGKDRGKPITMDDMKWFKDTFKVSFPMLFDQEAKTGAEYGVMFYPTIYILDRNGNVASVPTGTYTMGADGQPQSTRLTVLTPEELSAEIDKALAQ
jgi:thiol-disulfide isomerase/thioredoxin